MSPHAQDARVSSRVRIYYNFRVSKLNSTHLSVRKELPLLDEINQNSALLAARYYLLQSQRIQYPTKPNLSIVLTCMQSHLQIALKVHYLSQAVVQPTFHTSFKTAVYDGKSWLSHTYIHYEILRPVTPSLQAPQPPICPTSHYAYREIPIYVEEAHGALATCYYITFGRGSTK